MLRHARLAEVQQVDELADRALALAQPVEDPAAVGLGDGGERVHENILPIGDMNVKRARVS